MKQQTQKKEYNLWKIIAIIFIVLFAIETSFLLYSVGLYNRELTNTNTCYYDYCGNYPQATYQEGVCICYDYDVLGNYVQVKSKYFK